MAGEYKKVSSINISKECYKKLKIMSIQKDISVHEVAAELLEKVMSKKHNNIEEVA